MRQLLHVNQQHIAKNRKEGTNLPPIIVRSHRGSETAHEVELVLPDGTVVGKFVYSPHKPLRCGARLWLETDSKNLMLRPVAPSPSPVMSADTSASKHTVTPFRVQLEL